MFSKCIRHGRRILERGEVVTICNHLVPFGAIQEEAEIGGKALLVALNLLVQTLRRHPVESRKVRIQKGFFWSRTTRIRLAMMPADIVPTGLLAPLMKCS
jgi:hypothetical protein